MGFLVLLIVTVGATALALSAATGILLILFHLMRTTRVQLNSDSSPWQLRSGA